MSSEQIAVEQQSENAPKPHSLFLVLEGGGAKGIAHAAVWDVLEPLVSKADSVTERSVPAPNGRPKLKLTGVAGSSAGAIMAAFIAAGAKSGHLVDEHGRLPLCSALGVEYFYDIFGVRGWRRLKHIRFIMKPSQSLLAAAERLTPRAQKAKDTNENAHPYRAGLYSRAFWIGFFQRTYWSKFFTQSYWAKWTTFSYWVEYLDPAYWVLIGFVMLAVIGFLMDAIILKRPQEFAVALICFWFIARACFAVSRLALRSIENRRRKKKRRHISRGLRALFHPLTSLIVSLAFTTPVYALAIRTAPEFRAGLGDGPWAIILAPFLYALCGLLVGFSAIGSLRRLFKGTVSTHEIRRDLNTALASILSKEPVWNSTQQEYEWKRKGAKSQDEEMFFRKFWINDEEPVCFRDLWAATGIQLNVVTADVIQNAVYVYSTHRHWDFPVAKAVAGSAAIPFVFRPVFEGHKILVDGGVVSSIPAWIYRKDRTRDPDARIVAVGIQPEKLDVWIPYFLAARRSKARAWGRLGLGWASRAGMMWAETLASLVWPLRFMLNVGSTSAFGARVLELDASDRLDSFLMSPKFELLDFDKSSGEAREELAKLKRQARYHINNLLWGRQSVFEEVCSTISDYLLKNGRLLEKEINGRIRIFWAEREGYADAVRIKFRFGFKQQDLDDRLVLPYRSSMSGWAAQTKRSHYGDISVLSEMFKEPINRYRRYVRWKDLRWCWAIPIVARDSNALMGILAIESDKDMDYFDPVLASEAKLRAASWINQATGEIRRDEAGEIAEAPPVVATQMADLERNWALYFREKFLEIDHDALARGEGTAPAPGC